MNKKTVFAMTLFLVAMEGVAQVKCHIIGTMAGGEMPVEMVICRVGEDPKNSTLRPTLKDGRFECDVEDAQIERWHIVDFGEVMKKGETFRTGDFFVEDGATVTIQIDDDNLYIQSTGRENQAWQAMEQAAEDEFMPAYEKLDENDSLKMAELEKEYHRWTLDYYKAHPMLGFLLELESRLKDFHFNDTGLAPMLDIYHRQ